jgi:lipopolysaccharide export system permease protein
MSLVEETGRPAKILRFEGHERITQALIAALAPVLGFAVLMVGGFSRFGMWRQIFGAILALVVIEMIDNAASGPARADAALLPLVYVAPVAGLFWVWLILRFAGRTRRRRRAVTGPVGAAA